MLKVVAPVEACSTCGARGWTICPTCQGATYVIMSVGRPLRPAASFEPDAAPCPTCRTYGAVICPECNGSGKLYQGHEYGSGRNRPLRPYAG